MNQLLVGIDRRLVFFTSLLLLVGLVMVYGASSYEMAKSGAPFLYFSAHLKRVLLAIGVAGLAALVPYRLAGRLASYGFWVSVGLLVLTVTGSNVVYEAHRIPRWVTLLGVRLQPVELAKLSLALALPYWIDQRPKRLASFYHGLLPLLLAPGIVILLLALQPNFGSALAIAAMCGCILWVAGVRKRHLLLLLLSGAGMTWLAISHVSKLKHRVGAWLDLLVHEHFDPTWGYQPHQALVGLGHGGLSGVGPGNSLTRYEFLPAGHTDFIFAVLGEQLGFLGAAALVIVLGLWLARAMKIAARSRDGLGYLMALSIGAMIFSYAFINLAVVCSLLPVAGLPLPFLSYGGTAMLTNLVGVGVLLNISRHGRKRRRPTDRWKGVRP